MLQKGQKYSDRKAIQISVVLISKPAWKSRTLVLICMQCTCVNGGIEIMLVFVCRSTVGTVFSYVSIWFYPCFQLFRNRLYLISIYFLMKQCNLFSCTLPIVIMEVESETYVHYLKKESQVAKQMRDGGQVCYDSRCSVRII